MTHVRRAVLGTLVLVLICLGLVACGAPTTNPGNGAPAPTSTTGGYGGGY